MQPRSLILFFSLSFCFLFNAINIGSDIMRVQSILIRLLRQTATKFLLVAAFVYFLAFQYCRLSLWRDPHSAFFDISDVFEWKYSLLREHQATHYISHYNTPFNGFDDADDSLLGKYNPLMCAALATVKHEKDNYFEGTVGSLLSNLYPQERNVIHLKILFANTDPSQHPSWGQRWLDRLVDDVLTYNVSETDLRRLQELEEEHNFYEKGV